MKNSKEVNEALKVLKENGFYTEFLWSTKDVDEAKKSYDKKDVKYIIDEKTKHEMLKWSIYFYGKEIKKKMYQILSIKAFLRFIDSGDIKKVYSNTRNAIYKRKKVKVHQYNETMIVIEFKNGKTTKSFCKFDDKYKEIQFID